MIDNPRSLLFAALGSAAACAALAMPDAEQAALSIVEQTNLLRRSAGIAAVAADPQLTATARQFSAFMAKSDRYAHDADGRQPAERAAAQGYDFCLVAENIAYQYSTAVFDTNELASRFERGWENSPGHRRNMLDAEATQTGVALAQAPGSKRWYAVQMFGRPAALRMRFEIANRSQQPLVYTLGTTAHTLPPRVTRQHESCRVETLVMRLPGATQTTRMQPRGGDSFVVEPLGAGGAANLGLRNLRR